ncbi:MAG: hypothetical protein FWB98_05535 [Defluviitaleaceae bacterium]|nr:hypothetical protein [Defluviitaleaceae bacterium]
MYEFQAQYKYGDFSLHDCRVTRIENDDGNITLYFVDGYWITKSNPQNLHNKTLKTGASSLVFGNANCEDVIFNGKNGSRRLSVSRFNL